jgi:proline dehydrogenase
MEGTAYTDVTLDVYRRARALFPNTGLCIQAYLFRTAADLEPLIALGSGVRLERAPTASRPTRPSEESRRGRELFKLATRLLSPESSRKGSGDLGTHDAALVRRIEEHARDQKLPPQALEFRCSSESAASGSCAWPRPATASAS